MSTNEAAFDQIWAWEDTGEWNRPIGSWAFRELPPEAGATERYVKASIHEDLQRKLSTYEEDNAALHDGYIKQAKHIEELEQRLAEREAVIAYFIHTENPDGHHDSQIRADFWRED